MTDLAGRLRNRVQLTTDAHRPYLVAVEGAFGSEIDFAVLQKIYGTPPEADRRYTSAECIGVDVDVSSLMYRPHYALPDSIRGPEGRRVGAVHGYLDMVTRLLVSRRPDERPRSGGPQRPRQNPAGGDVGSGFQKPKILVFRGPSR